MSSFDDLTNEMALDGMTDLLWSGTLKPEEAARAFTFLQSEVLENFGLDVLTYCTVYWTTPAGVGAPDFQGWAELDQMIRDYGEPTTRRKTEAEWY